MVKSMISNVKSLPSSARNSSLLLMVSQSLNFDASFEGILGLGVPNVTAKIGPAGGTHRHSGQGQTSHGMAIAD